MAWSTVAAVLWFMFWTSTMVMAQIWCDYMPANDKQCHAMYDILHEFLPRVNFRPIADIWAVSHVIILTIYIFAFLPRNVSKERVIRIFFFLWGCLYALRTFSLIPTRYARIMVEGGTIHPNGVWWAFIGFFSGQEATVADYMFSGHTATMFLCSYFVGYYSNHSVWSSLLFVHSFVGAVLVSITWMHYTIDVLIAWWMVDWVFHRYHSIMDPEYLRAWRPGVRLTNIPGGVQLPATMTDASGTTFELVGDKGRKSVDGGKYYNSARYSLWRTLKAFDGGK